MQDDKETGLLFFKENMDVSENKMNFIKKYIEILDFYQAKLNLIGNSTRKNIWVRHILDSAQIINFLPEQNKNDFLLDVGTGAGFPGIILSILGRKDIILCDKSPKKTRFLEVVVKECKLKVGLVKGKVEHYNNKNIKIIVSRAYSPLNTFFQSVKHLISPETIFVIHKGKKYKEEIEVAKKYYLFSVNCYSSITDSFGKILKIKNVVQINES